MAIYQKHSQRMTYDIQLITVIGSEGIKPQNVLWKCKGKCWSPTNAEDSVQKHVLFEFPSGALWYVCKKCGSGVYFSDTAEREIHQLPTELQAQAKEDYNAFSRKIKSAFKKKRGPE